MRPLYLLRACQQNGVGPAIVEHTPMPWPEAVQVFQARNEMSVGYRDNWIQLTYHVVPVAQATGRLAEAA